MESKALISTFKYFKRKNNQLIIKGKSVKQIVEPFSTPAFLYDTSVVDKKVALFRKYFPKDICLYYAVKANPNIDLLCHINRLVDGFDVASSGEIKSVMKAGGHPENISFAGPGKTKTELKFSLDHQIGSINIESESELYNLLSLCKERKVKPKISVRINPDFELHGSGMKMGGGAKQFGIDAEKIPSIMKKINGLPVDFQGFHIYAGSQNLDSVSLCQVMGKTIDMVCKFSRLSKTAPKLLNFGGGFGIPYFKNDTELDMEKVGNFLNSRMPYLRQELPEAKLIIELGRYLVGECGLYVTRIVCKKESRGKVFLVTDGGMNHHLAASGNLGQIIKKNYPVIVPTEISSSQTEKVNIVGPLCTPLDSLALNVELPKVKEGDLIGIMNSGAYGYTSSPLLFLGHDLPKEILL